MQSQSDKSQEQPRADQPQPPSYAVSTENTTTSTVPNQPSQTRQPTGSGYGERVRGAIGVVHGAGESLRGNIIGAVDTLFGGKHEAEATQITEQGREEMHAGIGRMRGRSTEARGEQQQAQVAPSQEPGVPTGAPPQRPGAPPQETGAPAKVQEPTPQQQDGRTEQPGGKIPVTSWS